MSASEPIVDPPAEATPAEAAPVTEKPAVEETSAAPVTEIAAEAAILSPDAAVVTANLENAGPVIETPAETPAEATTTEADAAPPAEDTPAEAAPATPEKPKEGSSLLSFIKKHVPNPKTTDKKSSKAAAVETPAKTEEVAPATEEITPAVVEPVEEAPLESAPILFRTHGSFFGGGWKDRTLSFGKEDGYSKEALYPYVGVHKASSMVSGADKTAAAWSNAAHATVTGVGLLFVVKSKALDIPLNIVNLADVTEVVAYSSNFTIKTGKSGDYEFGAGTPAKAKAWQVEIEKRAEQSKLTQSGIIESEEYKTALAHFEGQKGRPAKTPEAVTSDEEGAVSGEETKKPGKWSRRISGSLGRLTSPTKEKESPEAAKEAVVAPVAEEAATETPAVAETAPVIPETTVTEPTETATDPAPAESKKEKRKSFTGFTTLFNKNKPAKEASPEPTATEEPLTEDAPAEVIDTAAVAPLEPVAATEEPIATPETPKADKSSKRGSIFGVFIPKKEPKDKTPALTNGDDTEPTAPATEDPVPKTSEPVDPPTDDPAVSETTPATPKKDSLSRRLTSQFRSLGRAKSPDKGKTAKVSDEAPKIDTAIESTPEAAPVADTPAPVEPLSTTEAPLAPVDSTPPTEQPQSAPVVSTQA